MFGDLLQTKLYLPRVRSSLVPRPRLVEKLDAALDGRLTLVSAPAGFGKTTLISEWANGETAGNVCWLSLDENDDDLTRFLTYLVAAIASLGGLWSTSILDPDVIAHYTNARSPDVETLLMILINEITAVALVFESLINVLLGDVQHSLELSHQALEMLPAESVEWRSYVYSNRGMAYVMNGDGGNASG